jgi:hypothetical protein
MLKKTFASTTTLTTTTTTTKQTSSHKPNKKQSPKYSRHESLCTKRSYINSQIRNLAFLLFNIQPENAQPKTIPKKSA